MYPGEEAGRIIGITDGAKDILSMSESGGQNTYQFTNLEIKTYQFKVVLNNGYRLDRVSVNTGSGNVDATVNQVGTTNEYIADIVLTEGTTLANVTPSFSSTGNPSNPGNPGEPSNPGNPGDPSNPGNPGQEIQDMKIWVGDNLVIDDTANPQIKSAQSDATNPVWKIREGDYHAAYELEILQGGITIPYIKVEGHGSLVINAASEIDHLEPGQVLAPDVIEANAEGYSIISNDPQSDVNIETKQGGGSGTFKLNGSIDITGALCVSDKDMTLGTTLNKIFKPIRARDILVQYAKLEAYSSVNLFEGKSEQNKMNIHVFDNGILKGNTTGCAFTNVKNIAVRTAGQIDVEHLNENLGVINKQVQYYDFVNFETTQEVEEMEDLVTLENLTEGTHEKYEMTQTTTMLHLKSLSKALWTLAYNMEDPDGNIVEDTKVEHGTVKVITACGIGRGNTGKGSGYFQIEQGTSVKILIMPDYGYQFTSGSLNGQPMDSQEGIGVYEFNMPSNHLHLNAVFTKTDDTIVVNNDSIVGASIGKLDGQIKGNAEFKVEDATGVNEDEFIDKSNGLEIAGYADLSLNQVVLKGDEGDSWKTGITDLNEEMEVSLKVSDDMAKQLENSEECQILRKHNGEINTLEAKYNKDTKIIKFKTNGYSTYAISYTTPDAANTSNTDTSKDKTPKTGSLLDFINPTKGVGIITYIAVISLMVVILKKTTRKSKRVSKH